MDVVSIIVSSATVIITGISLHFSLRQQIDKNNQKYMETALSSEKRHAGHEKQLELIEERRIASEALMMARIDDIRISLEEMKQLFHVNKREFIC